MDFISTAIRVFAVESRPLASKGRTIVRLYHKIYNLSTVLAYFFTYFNFMSNVVKNGFFIDNIGNMWYNYCILNV